jgi:iron complex outermembrane receptor protein
VGSNKKAVLAYGVAMLAIVAPGLASAQQRTADVAQDTANAAVDPGDIVVTARKSKESILKAPLSVSALTSEDIQKRGIVSLNDIAEFTTSMKVGNIGAGRNDRSFQQIIIRGFTPPTVVAQTTSVFIDGVPVSSATAVNNVSDPERVEILKGPQSAYFGRQTFAGAVNIVTKQPSQDWSGTIEAMGGTRANYDIMGEISGPLIKDILSIRLTGRIYGKDGSYANAGVPSQTLGDQKTKTGTVSLVFTPSDRLSVKLFGLLTNDDDGPAAQGFLSAYTVRDRNNAIVLTGQSNCVVAGHPYFCGVTPKLIGSPAVNTENDSFIKNALANPVGRLISPDQGVKGYGLLNRTIHLHMVADYKLGDTGVTLSSLTGYNRQRMSELTDIDDYYSVNLPNNTFGVIPGARTYFEFPYLAEQKFRDWSQEFRASYASGRFKGTIGASYLDADRQEGVGGGNGDITATGNFSSVQGKTRSKTAGVFFGLGYEIARGLTLDVDGRYQIDNIYAYTPPAGLTVTSNALAPIGFYAGGSVLAQKKYKNFMPRTIAQYQVNPDTMVYASYSEGVNPASFNTLILSNSPSIQQAVVNLGYKIAVDPEKLVNYEIGFKGKLFNNRVRYTFAAYRAIWKNQINFATIPILNPATNTLTNIQASLNAGRVRMTGLEGELRAYITPEWTVDLNGSINNSFIEALISPSTTALTGVSNFTGKQNPLVPKYSASGGLEYSHKLSGELRVFARGDLSFKSGVYSDASNVVRTPNLTLANFRVGLSDKNASIEAFVTNAFDNHAYTTAQGWPIFTSTFQYTAVSSALTLGLPDLRTVGIRVRHTF